MNAVEKNSKEKLKKFWSITLSVSNDKQQNGSPPWMHPGKGKDERPSLHEDRSPLQGRRRTGSAPASRDLLAEAPIRKQPLPPRPLGSCVQRGTPYGEPHASVRMGWMGTEVQTAGLLALNKAQVQCSGFFVFSCTAAEPADANRHKSTHSNLVRLALQIFRCSQQLLKCIKRATGSRSVSGLWTRTTRQRRH